MTTELAVAGPEPAAAAGAGPELPVRAAAAGAAAGAGPERDRRGAGRAARSWSACCSCWRSPPSRSSTPWRPRRSRRRAVRAGAGDARGLRRVHAGPPLARLAAAPAALVPGALGGGRHHRADGDDLELPSPVSGAAGDLSEGADADVRLHPDRAAHAALRAVARDARRGQRRRPAGWCWSPTRCWPRAAPQITHDFATYAMSYQILLGAEFDKVVSLLMVTLILAIALVRARKLLFRAVTDQLAAAELSRFFAPEVAGRIRDSDDRARAGPGGAARGGDPDGRPARLHAAQPARSRRPR